VEDRNAVGADTERQEHESQLRDRRVREHLLDVVLRDGDGRGEEGRCQPITATTCEAASACM
jgi:hypothetical protein